jgi:hypothetical protein
MDFASFNFFQLNIFWSTSCPLWFVVSFVTNQLVTTDTTNHDGHDVILFPDAFQMSKF